MLFMSSGPTKQTIDGHHSSQRKDHPKDTGFGAKTDDGEGPIAPESVGGVKTVRLSLGDNLGSPVACSLTSVRRRFETTHRSRTSEPDYRAPSTHPL